MNPLLRKMLQEFVPTIREKAVPGVENLLNDLIDGVSLKEGEDCTSIILSKYNNEWWAFLVTMTPDNTIRRIVGSKKLEDLVSLGIDQLNKI